MHEQLGQPVVSNGLPLTKIHHAAFDAHLIGIEPDYRIHVSDRLLEIHDGPFVELGLKGIAGQVIRVPRRNEDCPDRDRLAIRFEQFKKVDLIQTTEIYNAGQSHKAHQRKTGENLSLLQKMAEKSLMIYVRRGI